jgi:DNA primase
MISDLNVLREDGRYEDLAEKVLEYEEIDFTKIVERAGEEPRVRLTRKEKEDMLEARLEAELDPYRGSVPQYAIDRGLDIETCKVWELGHDKERKRLVFPVRRARDKALVGITGRTYIDENPKYFSGYFDWAKSKYLYGEWMLPEHAERVVIVEGPLDVIALWKAGEPALGIMGAAASSFQVQKIEYLDKPVYLFPDDDKAGHRWANQLGNELRELGVKVRDVQISKGQDPKDLDAQAIRKLLRNAPMRI